MRKGIVPCGLFSFAGERNLKPACDLFPWCHELWQYMRRLLLDEIERENEDLGGSDC